MLTWEERLALRLPAKMSRQQRRQLMPECAKIVDEWMAEFDLKSVDATEKASGFTYHWEKK